MEQHSREVLYTSSTLELFIHSSKPKRWAISVPVPFGLRLAGWLTDVTEFYQPRRVSQKVPNEKPLAFLSTPAAAELAQQSRGE